MYNQGRLQPRAPRPVKIGDFMLGKTLGVGAFASVRLAHHEKTGEQFAVKVIDRRKLDSEVYDTQVQRESKILQMLDHPNIVRLWRILKSRTCTYFFLEYVEGGDLYDEIVNNIHLEEDTARSYFLQLTSALAYAHEKRIMHRDIKPENILLDKTKQHIKIADFGMGWCADDKTSLAPLPESLLTKTQCGTPKYMPPELLCATARSQGYNAAKVDAWSCGMVLYACLAGYLPFTCDTGDETALLEQIVGREMPKFPEWFSAGAREVLRGALERDAGKRMDMQGLRDHAWTRGVTEEVGCGRRKVGRIRLDGRFGVERLEFSFGSPVTPVDGAWKF